MSKPSIKMIALQDGVNLMSVHLVTENAQVLFHVEGSNYEDRHITDEEKAGRLIAPGDWARLKDEKDSVSILDFKAIEKLTTLAKLIHGDHLHGFPVELRKDFVLRSNQVSEGGSRERRPGYHRVPVH